MVLGFNSLDGKTLFKTVDGKLGDYTITSYTPKTEKEFVESTSSYRDKDISKVTLKSSDGKTIELTVNIPYPTKGYLASFVNTDNGNMLYARKGDKIDFMNFTYEIESITTNTATVSSNGKSRTYPLMSENQIRQMYTKIKMQMESDRLAAIQADMKKKEAAQQASVKSSTKVVQPTVASIHSSRQTTGKTKTTTKVTGVSHTSGSAYYYGTDYPFPTEYTVFPVTKRNSKGNLYFEPVIVPTQFTRGYTGVAGSTK